VAIVETLLAVNIVLSFHHTMESRSKPFYAFILYSLFKQSFGFIEKRHNKTLTNNNTCTSSSDRRMYCICTLSLESLC